MDRWSQLSMKDKSDLMSLYIKNGISSLEEIKKHYNSYQVGGPVSKKTPNFVQRFNEGNKRDIPFQGGHATHLLSYAERDGKYYVYPEVQPTDYNNSNSPLQYYGRDWRVAFDRAYDNNDYLEFDTEESARNYSENYKKVPSTGAVLNGRSRGNYNILDYMRGYATGGHLYQDGGPDEPNFVGGATALKKNYDYTLEHLAEKYPVTAEGPWHDYGIHNPSYNQRAHWNELSKMYNRVAQRSDYQYLNPTNILEHTPIAGDAIDAGNSIYNLQQGETGLGLVGLGTLILPNVIEKPLKTINKAAINLLDDIRYSKYKKNARHIANNAYTNHLKRVGLTRNDIGSTDYQHSEDITRNIIQQNNYDVSTIDGRRQFLQDIGKIDNNATNEQVDNAFLKFLQSDNYNGNNRPGVYTFDNLKGQVMAVSDDAGMNFSRRKAAKGGNSNISLRNGQISDNFDWFNGNNESIKSHELTHYLQYKNNLIDGSRVNNIFDYNKLNNLSDKIKNYFTIDNGTEADARLSQILDFYNISNDRKIKPSHIRYVKNNYTGINNSMLPFLQALDDDKEVADYINKNRKSKFLENGGKINT